jgi:holo-[acyl-carrier protein] synthase
MLNSTNSRNSRGVTSIGIDIVEIERIELAIKQWGKRFLKRIYTEAELDICQDRISSLAARFAAKEAVMKVLGTGAAGLGWREIEILADANGKPLVQLYGRARQRAKELNLNDLLISLSDSKQYAVAAAVSQ